MCVKFCGLLHLVPLSPMSSFALVLAGHLLTRLTDVLNNTYCYSSDQEHILGAVPAVQMCLCILILLHSLLRLHVSLELPFRAAILLSYDLPLAFNLGLQGVKCSNHTYFDLTPNSVPIGLRCFLSEPSVDPGVWLRVIRCGGCVSVFLTLPWMVAFPVYQHYN